MQALKIIPSASCAFKRVLVPRKENIPQVDQKIGKIGKVKTQDISRVKVASSSRKVKFSLKSANSFSMTSFKGQVALKKKNTQIHLIESKSGKSGSLQLKNSLRVHFRMAGDSS